MLEVILALAAAILLGNMLAHRIRVTPAILLIFLGLVLALLPAMHDVREVGLPPHVILEIFLPIMLFWEARGTSLREVRKSFRAIVTSGTTLVVATALAIAWALNSIFGIDWGTALIIGAALAPTDATAVATLNGKLPKRSITVLKAESLINDGTTLVMFALALHLAGGADVSLPLAGGMLGFSFLCGIIVGLAVGWAANRLRAYITNPMNYTIFMMAVPFSAFLLSETIEISDGMKGSGVVAVVVAAFYMTYNGIDTITPQNRFYGLPIWAYVSYLMNGALFVLVGVQLPEIWRSMEDIATKHNYPLIGGLSIVLVAWSVSMLVRFLMMRPNMISDVKMDVKSGADGADAGARGNAVVRHFVTRWKVRRILREPELRGAIFRDRVVSTMAGLRGGVSLAVALSVGTAVESRDFIIFVVAAVVLLSMVVQGLLLPAVIRWARIPSDDTEERETLGAVRALHVEAYKALDQIAADAGVCSEAVQHVRADMDFERDAAFEGRRIRDDNPDLTCEELQLQTLLGQVKTLRLAVITYQRGVLKRLRNEGAIDMNILHGIQERLDTEEVRILGPVELE